MAKTETIPTKILLEQWRIIMADRTTVDEHVNNIWSELDLIIKKDPEFAKRFIDRFSPPEYIRQQLRTLDLHLADENKPTRKIVGPE